MIFRSSILAIIIVTVCLFGYAKFFNHSGSNVFSQQVQDAQMLKAQRLENAMNFLKDKNYAAARQAVLLDHPFTSGIPSKVAEQEKNVYGYCEFILAREDDPITKYVYIKSVKPIEGIVTEEQLAKYVTEWKPKSEAASANIEKQKNEALEGLATDEQSFVVLYVSESINGKTPDPGLVATHATHDLTVAQAKKKAVQWMDDPKIQTAIEKYNSITMKYDPQK